jgi:hypothetical protein
VGTMVGGLSPCCSNRSRYGRTTHLESTHLYVIYHFTFTNHLPPGVLPSYSLSPPPRQISPIAPTPAISPKPPHHHLVPLHLHPITPQRPRILSSTLSRSPSLHHVCSHGHPSSHIHIEHAKSPPPSHHPFTTSCQFLQSSRQPLRIPTNLTMNSLNRSRWQNAKASTSYRCIVDWGLPQSQ